MAPSQRHGQIFPSHSPPATPADDAADWRRGSRAGWAWLTARHRRAPQERCADSISRNAGADPILTPALSTGSSASATSIAMHISSSIAERKYCVPSRSKRRSGVGRRRHAAASPFTLPPLRAAGCLRCDGAEASFASAPSAPLPDNMPLSEPPVIPSSAISPSMSGPPTR